MPAVRLPSNLPLRNKVEPPNSSIAWKVHFESHGKGNYAGEREPTKPMDMQRYYYLLQKRKEELSK